MKVKELIAILSFLDDDTEVYIQKDPEGNGYYGLRGADPEAIVVIDDGEVQVYDRSWSADEADMSLIEWEQLKKQSSIVVLYP